MLRDRNLIPLSHQHQHALALCVQIDRSLPAGTADLDALQAQIRTMFNLEIRWHFAAEEEALFPEAAAFPELKPLVEQLLREHATLREYFAGAERRELDAARLRQFAQTLSGHIRKEERELFEACQRLFSAEKLAAVGAALDAALHRVPRPIADFGDRPN
ncbi:MAG TPA: hemerythrin domain-containing protein [Terriglobales bacterium]|nr:hemerythrin domain-containing protein [Terriglobales bacterium]